MPLSLNNREPTGAHAPSSEELRHLVLQNISPISTNQCKFTHQELIMLALSGNTHRWILCQDMGIFVVQRIRYYQNLAAKHFFRQPGGWYSSHELFTLAHQIESCLSDFQLPIRVKLNEDGHKTYSLTVGSAYYFLRHLGDIRLSKYHRLEIQKIKAKQQRFPFMRLPADLRRQIYKLVLEFSDYRLYIHQYGISAFENRFPVWEAHKGIGHIAMPPRSTMLALLSVNKLVHDEAMPEFYRMNDFHFSDCRMLKTFLRGIGPERRKCVASVCVRYSNITCAPAAAKLLLESDMLQRLTMLINVIPGVFMKEWFKLSGTSREYRTIDGIPGLKNIRKIRGIKDLKFGPCDHPKLIDDHLRPSVTQPRPKPRVVEPPKRKSKKNGKKGDLYNLITSMKSFPDEEELKEGLSSVDDDGDHNYQPPTKKRKLN